ncbi:hypothetical protein Patl1_33806 [Pistacia atlantica]|uniref:Uncharacterized protein n=1 Tax=Pistacia atlantica TaxID=434234 RepID=A0ACC0ZQ97_9ROSI|nr:hypothetical protein Patl1_33806 [Pistacia atlantica]
MFLSLSTSLAANSLSFRAASLLSLVFPLSLSTGTFSFLYFFPPLSPNSPNCHSHHHYHYHYRGPLCSSSFSTVFSYFTLLIKKLQIGIILPRKIMRMASTDRAFDLLVELYGPSGLLKPLYYGLWLNRRRARRALNSGDKQTR